MPSVFPQVMKQHEKSSKLFKVLCTVFWSQLQCFFYPENYLELHEKKMSDVHLKIIQLRCNQKYVLSAYYVPDIFTEFNNSRWCDYSHFELGY